MDALTAEFVMCLCLELVSVVAAIVGAAGDFNTLVDELPTGLRKPASTVPVEQRCLRGVCRVLRRIRPSAGVAVGLRLVTGVGVRIAAGKGRLQGGHRLEASPVVLTQGWTISRSTSGWRILVWLRLLPAACMRPTGLGHGIHSVLLNWRLVLQVLLLLLLLLLLRVQVLLM